MAFKNAACSSPRSTRQGATMMKKGRTKSARLEGVRALGGHAVPTFATVGCFLSAAMAATCALANRVPVFLRNERRTWSAERLGVGYNPRYGAIRECYLHHHTGWNAHDRPQLVRSASTEPGSAPGKVLLCAQEETTV